jgi:hypothetical protein
MTVNVKSNSDQIIQGVLDATNQSLKVSVVGSAGQVSVKDLKYITARVINSYAVTPVNTVTPLSLIASISTAITKLEIFDSSGSILKITNSVYGDFYVFPGGNGAIDTYFPVGSSLTIVAVDATASVGYFVMNAYSDFY